MIASRPSLSNFKVPLDEQARRQWEKEHGIVAIYVNDIGAGALIRVPPEWDKDASTPVAKGLRLLLQELWRLDLARPVLAVFWPAPGAEGGTAMGELRRLAWDQESHRGDFALREAPAPHGEQTRRAAAEALLEALLGDTMEALDINAREDKVDFAEVMKALEEHQKQFTENAPAVRLDTALLAEMQRARETGGSPDLVAMLDDWLRAEEVGA